MAADDVRDPASDSYRSRAADLFEKALKASPAGTENEITLRIRQVDVLRRAGRFDEAVGVANEPLDERDLDATIRAIVSFGLKLAQSQDPDRHNVDDAWTMTEGRVPHVTSIILLLEDL